LENNIGNLAGFVGRYLTKKNCLVGTSNAIEQQLQMQKGVQRSSPQPLECWSWSEICWCSTPKKCLAISTTPLPPSPQGASDSANIYMVNIRTAIFIRCKDRQKRNAIKLHFSDL